MTTLKQLRAEHPQVLLQARLRVNALIRRTFFEEKLWLAGFCLVLKRNDLILLFARHSLGELRLPELAPFIYAMR